MTHTSTPAWLGGWRVLWWVCAVVRVVFADRLPTPEWYRSPGNLLLPGRHYHPGEGRGADRRYAAETREWSIHLPAASRYVE